MALAGARILNPRPGFQLKGRPVRQSHSASQRRGAAGLPPCPRCGARDNCPTGSGNAPFDISGGGSVLGFQLDVPTDRRIRLDAYSPEFTPALYVREGGCAGGTELACQEGSAIGDGVAQARLDLDVSADTHFAFVDGGRFVYALYYEP